MLRHAVNLGQGAALATGIAYALSRGAQYIVTFDADGQHIPEEIPKLLAPVLQGTCDIALGTRFLDQSNAVNIPRKKKLLLRCATIFTRLTTQLNVTDTHNGFRAMSAAAARRTGRAGA